MYFCGVSAIRVDHPSKRRMMNIDTEKISELQHANEEIRRAIQRVLDQTERFQLLQQGSADSVLALVLLENMQKGLVGMYMHRRVIKREVHGDLAQEWHRQFDTVKGESWVFRALSRAMARRRITRASRPR
jgi:hypothetical protein